MTTSEIKSQAGSRIYRRENMAALKPTTGDSIKYSRSFARRIFERLPKIEIVEYVTTGNKTDSQYVGKRGVQTPPENVYVRICSTGGKWGKSASDYYA
jgi:hypothetical protein